MSKKAKIAFVIEGTKTEPLLIQNIKNTFFEKNDVVPIMLPTCTNIYALCNRIKEDDYETDIIELVIELSKNQSVKRVDQKNDIDFRTMKKSDFSEIYLFFDYDGHNNNLPNDKDVNETLSEMLDVFNNETELGKMYISYPMIESIKHFSSLTFCNQNDICIFPVSCGTKYKYLVSKCTLIQDVRNINLEQWQYIIKKFLISVSCLCESTDQLNIKKYKDTISPKNILNYQMKRFIIQNQVMIISAIPEFLLDYFKTEKLNELFSDENIFLDIKCKNGCDKIH